MYKKAELPEWLLATAFSCSMALGFGKRVPFLLEKTKAQVIFMLFNSKYA